MFVKNVPTETRKTKMLYLMGATWHNKCMFDLDTIEDSIADIFQKLNIETYTFNYVGTGPNITESVIGDHNSQMIDYAVQLINENNIQFVFGYSYGCMLAREIVSRCPNLKGLILLDPKSDISMDIKVIDDDKLLITKEGIRNALLKHGAAIKSQIVEDHLESVSTSDTLITAFYPRIFYRNNQVFFVTKDHVDSLCSSIPTKVFFTKNTSEDVRKLYTNHTYYDDASHWIMLEDMRYVLVNEITKFIGLTINHKASIIETT